MQKPPSSRRRFAFIFRSAYVVCLLYIICSIITPSVSKISIPLHSVGRGQNAKLTTHLLRHYSVTCPFTLSRGRGKKSTMLLYSSQIVNNLSWLPFFFYLFFSSHPCDTCDRIPRWIIVSHLSHVSVHEKTAFLFEGRLLYSPVSIYYSILQRVQMGSSGIIREHLFRILKYFSMPLQ